MTDSSQDKQLLVCVSSIASWVTNGPRNETANASRVVYPAELAGDALQVEFNIPENVKWNLHVITYLDKSLLLLLDIATSKHYNNCMVYYNL